MGSSIFFDAHFDAIVEQALKFYHCPGLSIAVVHKGTTYAKGYGFANIESKTAVTPETLFYTGSTTKSFTAAAYSIIASEPSKYGGVDWSTPISHITPEDFVLADEWATNHVTVKDALSHRTGYPGCDMAYGQVGTNMKDTIRLLRHLPMVAEPRVEWRYQNIMYTAVSNAIEKVTGMWLGDFLRQNIWTPLDMASTFFTLEHALQYVKASKGHNVQLATGYRWVAADEYGCRFLTGDNQAGHFVEEPYMNLSHVSGAGTMISSVVDYAKYLHCMLQQSEPIPPLGHRALRQAHTLINSEVFPTFHEIYARGGGGPVEIYRHPGALYGFRAEMVYVPKLELGIITLGNGAPTATQVGQLLVYEIVDNLLGIDRSARFDLKKEHIAQEEALLKTLPLQISQKRLFGPFTGSVRPLRISMQDHAGKYSNAGYGEVTISVRSRDANYKLAELSDSAGQVTDHFLRLSPSPHTWRWAADLTHVSDEWFLASFVNSYPPLEFKQNPDRYQYGDEGVLETRVRAVFKLEPQGAVRRLGIELEPDVADAEEAKQRRGKGDKRTDGVWDWDIEKGMIWFERID
ncbi:hypothetical protein EPUS_03063 [Endocarpon pusillum Z07020]|uniref:Beta-lactamase-related domain-containing protein n=1 Tax=Endocarpon pusillum (strain Z07020 / HMAS-L-300199) TaxID=1263415 RepID=U1G748_ENDPU|nr:uncharacterized protein EPUS_03063 [Endocarpon pusillum Z07020]ERF73222.1 hypothetical protein EPUS_03063 [Endocarpon pusillum Z07020]